MNFQIVPTDVRLGIAATLAALAAGVVTYHWGVLLANLHAPQKTTPDGPVPGTGAGNGRLACLPDDIDLVNVVLLPDRPGVAFIPSANWRGHQR